MICPSCGVDSELYLKQKVEKDRVAEREREFEQTYGLVLEPIRRRRAWIGGIVGGLLCAAYIIFGTWMMIIWPSQNQLGVVTIFWERIKTAPGHETTLVFSAILLIVVLCGLISAILRYESKSKQEKEWRKNFGLLS